MLITSFGGLDMGINQLKSECSVIYVRAKSNFMFEHSFVYIYAKPYVVHRDRHPKKKRREITE